MSRPQLAQINIARLIAPLDDPMMEGFVSRLTEINALADSAPGFVWRLQTPEGDATYLRVFEDDQILVNMSVWESIEHLKQFTYKTVHTELLLARANWFEKMDKPSLAMWWVPAGHIPGMDEAKKRLANLETHGPLPFAFTFKSPFPPDENYLKTIDWSAFEPWVPAT